MHQLREFNLSGVFLFCFQTGKIVFYSFKKEEKKNNGKMLTVLLAAVCHLGAVPRPNQRQLEFMDLETIQARSAFGLKFYLLSLFSRFWGLMDRWLHV